MKLCILCENSKIEEVRERGKSIFPNNLTIGASATGNEPATHWFCFLTVSQNGYNSLLELQEHTIMEESGPKDFLAKWNLKIIK